MSPPKSARFKLSAPFSTPNKTPFLSNANPTSLRKPVAKISPNSNSKPPLVIDVDGEIRKRRIRERKSSTSTFPTLPTLTYK